MQVTARNLFSQILLFFCCLSRHVNILHFPVCSQGLATLETYSCGCRNRGATGLPIKWPMNPEFFCDFWWAYQQKKRFLGLPIIVDLFSVLWKLWLGVLSAALWSSHQFNINVHMSSIINCLQNYYTQFLQGVFMYIM